MSRQFLKRNAFNVACFFFAFILCVSAPRDYSSFLAFTIFILWPFSAPVIAAIVVMLIKRPPWDTGQKYLAGLIGVMTGCLYLIYFRIPEWPFMMRAWES